MKIARINNEICISFSEDDEQLIANEVKLAEVKIPQLRGGVLSKIAEIFSDDLRGGCGIDDQKENSINWDIVSFD